MIQFRYCLGMVDYYITKYGGWWLCNIVMPLVYGELSTIKWIVVHLKFDLFIKSSLGVKSAHKSFLIHLFIFAIQEQGIGWEYIKNQQLGAQM